MVDVHHEQALDPPLRHFVEQLCENPAHVCGAGKPTWCRGAELTGGKSIPICCVNLDRGTVSPDKWSESQHGLCDAAPGPHLRHMRTEIAFNWEDKDWVLCTKDLSRQASGPTSESDKLCTRIHKELDLMSECSVGGG